MPLFPFGFPFGRSLVFGTPGDDTLPSGPGSNVIFGFGGNDTLFSSAANNILFGNRGDDTFQYLAGADRFVGGSGHDTVVVSEGNLFDYLDDFPTLHVGRPTRQTEFTSAQTGETFRVSGVEAITFEAQDLTVFLDGTNNAVFAQDDEVRASGAGVTTFGLQEFKENDIDFDGDELQSFLLLSETGSNGGRATVNASGTVDFDADGDFDDLLIGQTAITTFTYTIDDGRGGAGLATISITVEGEAEPIEARINEIHYDNVSLDVGEFVEIRTSAGADASDLVVELYNGTTGAVYSTSALGDVETDDAISVRSDGVFDYYVIELPTNGIQNGSPDGLALSNDGALIEFLSYEGSFVAVGGAADGATSVDIGVEETGSTPVGFSLQRLEGDLWDAPRADTRGAANTVVAAVFLNEIAVSTTGSPDFEFFEIFGAAGTSLDGYSLIQVEAGTAFNPGNILTVVSLDGQVIGEDGFFLAASPEAEADFGVVGDLQIPDDSFENFDSTVLLVRDFDGGEGTDLDANDDGLIDAELQIVDGVALADSGPSIFYGGVPVVGPDGTFLAAGAKRIEDGSGDFVQTSFSSTGDYTPGSTNTPAGEAVLISAIQGAGDASPLVGETVVVEAVVTAIVDGGFFLQEEEDDGDGNAATSEGIFVSGDSSAVSVGDLVEVTGTVEESFGRTQIALSTASVVMSGVALPAAAAILVGPEAADYEAVEGMRVSVSSATDDPLTITANFNFDRFGELQISAGNKRQPTQQFDPQDEAAEVAALAEANANNTLLLDDGVSAQNPTEFRYVPVPEEFDNGNGFLDTGDDFGGEDGLGATLRLGTEITAPIEGVMDFSFGDYKVIPTTLLEIDESTNSGARPELEDVGGDLQVVSANVLNYFATLDIGDAGVGPGELDPRGADSQSELDRQTDKLVAQLLATEGEVFALQELGNDGFGADGSVSVLTQGLNAESTIDYAFVDPFGNGASGDFVGTDAITTGIIYDTSAVTLVYSDILVFEEASAAATFALADVLNPFASADDQVGDFQRNRPAVAATFEDNATGEYFTVVSVHFKSKGDSNLEDLIFDAQNASQGAGVAAQADIDALLADPNYDQGDGQAFWNQAREDAADELNTWITGEYLAAAQAVEAGVGDQVLILGDFNAYAEEDPTQVFDEDEDYTDILDTFTDGGQAEAYSFVFDGQQGALDQAFATDTLAGKVTDAFEWHVNADEPDLLNYDESFNDPGFYDDGLFGASDHDPLIIGLDFGADSIV